MNTLFGPLISDRGGVSSGAGLSKKSVAAQHKTRMKKTGNHQSPYIVTCIEFTWKSYPVSLTDARVSSLLLGACEVLCLLKTRAGKNLILRNKSGFYHCISYCLCCCACFPQYLTNDSRSTSSPSPRKSSCLELFASEFETD